VNRSLDRVSKMAAELLVAVAQGLKPIVLAAHFGTRPRGYPGRALTQSVFLKHALVKVRMALANRCRKVENA
jgi:hypothetical protein